MSLEVGALVWIRNNQSNSESTWIPSTVKAIEPVSVSTQTVKVETKDNQLVAFKFPTFETESEDIKPRNILAYTDKDDLIDLPFLNEPEILLNLKLRFEASKIFTKAGPILLTINPFDEVVPNESCINVAREFVDYIRRQAITPSIENGKKTNHSILISGESGSGKTESFKLILTLLGKQNHRYPTLARLESKSGGAGNSEWFSKALLIHKVLETFGNAMTMHTANSSRFGKVVEVNLTPTGEMFGMTTRTYLLESSRTTTQQLQERNFNIFYQLLAGATSEEREKWKITSFRDYHYTNQGGDVSNAWEAIDAANFLQLKKDILKIGIEKNKLSELFDALVGILHLGEVKFEDRGDISGGTKVFAHADVNTPNPLSIAAQFLGITPEQLSDLMTYKSFTSRGEKIIRPLNTAQAKVARDAIAKAIYRGLFDWIVNSFNTKLLTSTNPEELKDASSVILVDIFGFDSFRYNSMDQLCINYANEVLQQLFNFHVFKRENALYLQENIQHDDGVKFTDNKDNIDLITSGVFRILDDECRLPEPNDKKFLAHLYKDLSSHKLFSGNPLQQNDCKFIIQHYSGPVEYTADNFIEKNLDNLPTDTGKILLSSKNSILVACVQGSDQSGLTGNVKRRSSLMVGAAEESKVTRSNAPSFVAQVKADLALLVKDVEPTELHYVRCLKPFDPDRNWQFQSVKPIRRDSSSPRDKVIRFSNIKITEQLRYGGVLEAIKITRTKFRAHIPYIDFYNRYRTILSNLPSSLTSTKSFNGPKFIDSSYPGAKLIPLVKQLLETIASITTTPSSPVGREKMSRAVSLREMGAILNASFLAGKALETNKIQLGLTLVFLRVREYEVLEAMRNGSLVTHIIVLQTVLRRVTSQRRYQRMKSSIRLLQRVYRGFASRLYCKRLRLLEKAVNILQKNFRVKRFARKAFKIQMFYRLYAAKKKYRLLKEHRTKIVSIYGPFITARDMRIRRRNLWKHFPPLTEGSNGISYIPPLEARFTKYSMDEIELVKSVMSLVSNSKLNEDQLQGELEFDKLMKELSIQISSLPIDEFKAKCVSSLKEMRLAEHILKLRKLTDNTLLGSLGGSTIWKSLSKYAGDIPKVNLTPQHGLFIRINECMTSVNHLKQEGYIECEHLEKMRQNVRVRGVTGNSDAGAADLAIATYTAQIKCVKKIMALYEIVDKYYKHFITSFIREYGEESPFRNNYSTEKEYLKGLIEVVRAAKKYIPIPITQQAAANGGKQNVYRVGNCPLKVDWRENFEIPKTDISFYSRNPQYQSDLVKILLSLDLKKREFNLDNLRILDFYGIGYQYQPVYPAISYAMNAFTQLLGGGLISARRIVKLAGTRQLAGRVTYYQAVNGQTRASFMDVLYNPIQVEQIESFSYSISVIACMVLGLFNVQPNHILVNYEGVKDSITDQVVKISGFNTDAILAAQFLDYNNPSRYRIHQRNINVLFFLPQMDEPINSDVRAFLTSSPFVVEEIITSWLRDLFDQNRRFAALKSAGLTPTDFKNLSFPLMLPAGTTIEMRRRLNRICRLLRMSSAERESGVASSEMTLSRILETAFPPIGEYYSDLRRNSDFKEHVEGLDGVVSYAYMYHQALDAERRVGLGRKGSALGNASEVAVNAASSVAGMIRKSFTRRKGKKSEEEVSDTAGGVAEAEDEIELDDDSSLDARSSISSRNSRTSLASNMERRNPGSGFGYDQIYLESQVGEKIPGVDDDEQEEGLGMTTYDPEDKARWANDAKLQSVSSEYDAPIDRSRLYKLTTPTGASIFQFDQVYEKKSTDIQDGLSRSKDSAMRGIDPLVGFSQSMDFVQEPPSPFRILQRKIIMQTSTPKMDPIPEFDYEVFNKENRTRSTSSTQEAANGKSKPTTPVAANASSTSRKTVSLSNVISAISPRASAGKSANAATNPQSAIVDDEASYLAYQKNETDIARVPSATIKYEAPPEEFKKIPRRTVSKFDHDLLGEEARITPMNRTIEEEGFEFYNSLDWRDFADLRPFGQAEEFCEMVGRNLTFLSSVWLNHINDWQFKALFRYWVKAYRGLTIKIPNLRAHTREVILRYASKEDMYKMQSCSGLSKLLKKFHIDLKFAVLSENDAQHDSLLLKTMSFSQDTQDPTSPTNHGIGETKQMRKKKSMKPVNPATEQYDIYSFTGDDLPRELIPTSDSQDSFDERDFAKTGLTLDQEITERSLRHALWSCLNRIKTSELEHMDEDIQNVFTIIRLLVKNDQTTLISSSHVQSFTRLLVEYPILTPIALMIAEKKGFINDLMVLHRLLSSRYVNKYADIILSILYHHPEVLMKPDPEGYLPCDRIKRIPKYRHLKYLLLTKFVNFAPGPFTHTFQGINKGIFSSYRGEEELIVWAAHYDFPATELELKMKRFDLWKKDATNKALSFLWKLILTERDALNTSFEKENVWKVYQLLVKVLLRRSTKGEFTPKDIEDYIWKSVDMNLLPSNYISLKRISMKEIEQVSKVYQDLKQFWIPGKVRNTMKLRKIQSFSHNPISRRLSLNNNNPIHK